MGATRLLMVAESLFPGNGGICRVARLMGKSLAAEARDHGLDVDALIYSDRQAPADISLPSRLARSSKLRFAAKIHTSALSHSHYVYDFAGLARVHPRLPMMRRPFATFIHGIEVWEGAEVNRIEAARRADLLLVNSSYTRQRAQRVHGGLAHAKVCWLATEADEVPGTPRQLDGPPTVLIMGRIEGTRDKGHKALIQCWDRVVAAVPGARLVIVGRGPDLERMMQLAAASPASASIEFKGFVPDEQVEQLWLQSHVFAMPSMGEGFGLVYIEAMRYGIPVIASVHDAAPEISIDGQTGYNVNLQNPDQLPQRLVQLLKDPDHAASLGREGQQRWMEHFRFSAFRQRFTKFVRELVAM